WVPIDEHVLSGKRRDLYLRRVRAVNLYLANATDAQIHAECGFGRHQIYRVITERCLGHHPDGSLWGWRGLLPHFRTRRYERTRPIVLTEWSGGAVGALQYLFESPAGKGLEEKLRQQILGKRADLEATRRSRIVIFRWFINELRLRGVERLREWPFNVEKRGYVTLCKYIDQVLAENPARARALIGGIDAVKKGKSGDGSKRPQFATFERVECDAHKLDSRMIVHVPSPHGGTEPRLIHRLWVIVILEVTSRAVLGYQLSLRRECSADDVLRAVRCALSPWRPRTIQAGNESYLPKAGLPSYRLPYLEGACWTEFSVDGALANVCGRVETVMRDTVGACIIKPQDKHSFSQRRSLDDRPFIESFFANLAARGFHKLSTTTGNSPKSRRGTQPEQAAIDTQFQLENAAELLDTLIANYNATPHSGIGYRTPLEQIEFLTSDRSILRIANASAVRRLAGVRKLCLLRGGIKTGRRAHFQLENAQYSAEWLCLRADLLGKNFWLHIEDEDDARFATVSSSDGIFLGIVRAAPPWHRTPHSLYVRSSIRALEKRRLLHIANHGDAVETLIRHAEGSPKGKLPVHPAYLEARRILQQQAQKYDDQTTMNTVSDEADVQPSLSAQSQKKAPAAKNSTKLPPMRRAQQW
ncbi:integrase core domain-containing protein, partial [Robbsia andropogonis]|uniref:hypothetical protein n=1 Tax=Robbsia andropogonis TaxID=28092 RepID=UPI000463ED6E